MVVECKAIFGNDSNDRRRTGKRDGQEIALQRELYNKQLEDVPQIVFPFAIQIIVINPRTVVFFAEYNIENLGNLCISH